MSEDGGYTEQHPMWREAYRHEILRQAGLQEKDELGGYESLKDLVDRYREEAGEEKAGVLGDFERWNMEQVYRRNRLLNTKQRLRKRLTDMKRERTEKYHALIKSIIQNYARANKDRLHEDDQNCSEEEEPKEEAPVVPTSYRVSYKQPQKCPRSSSNPGAGCKSPQKQPSEAHEDPK